MDYRGSRINPELLIKLWRKKGKPDGWIRINNQYGMDIKIVALPYGDIYILNYDLIEDTNEKNQPTNIR